MLWLKKGSKGFVDYIQKFNQNNNLALINNKIIQKYLFGNFLFFICTVINEFYWWQEIINLKCFVRQIIEFNK